MENENKDNNQEINPTEFIKKASETRMLKIQQEQLEKIRREQQIIQDKINRKIREKIIQEEKKKKVKKIEDLLKKGDKIRWEIVNEGNLKGFVKNKLVFEIKRGLSIFNLYVKDNSLLKENTKVGYISCSYNLEKVKRKSEDLLK